MRIAFFEDRLASNFAPLALLRPVFELVCGEFSLRERLIRALPVTAWSAFLRPELAAVYREEQPEAAVNRLDGLRDGPTLLINGRWLPDRNACLQLATYRAGRLPDHAGLVNGSVAYLPITPAEVDAFACLDFDDAVTQLAQRHPRAITTGCLLEWPWDLVEHNAQQLVDDFESRRTALPVSGGIATHADSGGRGAAGAYVRLGPAESVSIDPAAEIDPFVVIDARRGPVSIAAGARIQAFTRLEGPCHVGWGSHLFRANVRGGTTIGPVCRVGGELEAVILHSHVNKYHDGFLGHGYVCPWVNLGASTSSSDLKSDYSTINVPLNGEPIDSGLSKVGTFIGDHTKTGLCSLFNTGSSVGAMCLVLPTGGFLPRYLPSFTGIRDGRLAEGLPLERSLAAARVAMARRDRELTTSQETLLRWLHQQTAKARAHAIAGSGRPRSNLPARMPSDSERAG